ncbi:hypothetical protein [Microcystis panniformis]|uniref:hypothetical protein n=1 Tax=Microcystis panniformis TaxID=513223 RepID=UPI00130E5E93|nr:hypothetical protein [Microcystis panniformis]
MSSPRLQFGHLITKLIILPLFWSEGSGEVGKWGGGEVGRWGSGEVGKNVGWVEA